MAYQNDFYVAGVKSTFIAVGGTAGFIDPKEIYIGSTKVYDGRPKLVTGLTGAFGSGVVTLNWTNNSKVAEYIRIERKTGVGGTWTEIENFLSSSAIEYEDTFSTEGTHYYRVLPRNVHGYVTDGAMEAEIIIQTFYLDPTSVIFEEGDPALTEKTTQLWCPNSWTTPNVDYGTGPDGWFDWAPKSGSSVNGATITVTAQVQVGEWIGASITFRDSVTELTKVLLVTVESPV